MCDPGPRREEREGTEGKGRAWGFLQEAAALILEQGCAVGSGGRRVLEVPERGSRSRRQALLLPVRAVPVPVCVCGRLSLSSL